MKSNFRKGTALLIMLLVLGGIFAAAQTPLGKLAGTVQDKTNAVIANAKVTVINEGTGEKTSTTSTNVGAFVVPQLRPGFYTVRVEVKGFQTAEYKQVKIDPGQEYSLTATMQLGTTTEIVEVVAGEELVNTTTAEINATVAQKQMSDLPLNGRNPLQLINLQAGVVGISNRAETVINGGRPSWSQVTQDGINIQDNFIRSNALDFVPNRPTADSIGEFSITTNNEGADSAGGSTQVKFITPSGTNAFHGSLYEYNRNSALSANDWFNNQPDPLTGKVEKTFLNRNQFGGKIGGPIKKNKLFFFGYYEGMRLATQGVQENIIPLHDDLLQGVYKYRDANGAVQSVNVLTLSGMNPGTKQTLTVDPTVQAKILSQFHQAADANMPDIGGDGLNWGTYRFKQSQKTTNDKYGFRLDYEVTPSHHVEFIHDHFTETDDRGDIDITNTHPKAYTDAFADLYAASWRWTINSRVNNELRAGGFHAPVNFVDSEDLSPVLFNIPTFLTNPKNNFLFQGRDPLTMNYADNVSYMMGNHNFRFGGSMQQVKVEPYNANEQAVTFGFSQAAASSLKLSAANFVNAPASTASLVNNANAMRAFLAGYLTSSSSTFEVTSQTSGFVPNAAHDRTYSFNDTAFYFTDSWRVKSNLTLTYGLKWEYFSPIKEAKGLALLPVVPAGQSYTDALMDPLGKVGYVNGGLWKADKNNFAPTISFAWDPFKNGKTSIRGGYSLAYVNDEAIKAADNASIGNNGLSSTRSITNLTSTLNAGVPTIATPTYKVPRTFADQLALSPTSAAFGIDPSLRQPLVHQVSFGIQRELPHNMAIEARYVGTFARDLWRGVDLNQTKAPGLTDYMTDFNNARKNGFIALNTNPSNPGCMVDFGGGDIENVCGSFFPDYIGLPGQSDLPFFYNNISYGGNLSDPNFNYYIQTGEAAALANLYVGSYRAYFPESPAIFQPNPGIYAADVVKNQPIVNYNALQVELRRRLSSGLMGQINYTWSKALSDVTVTGGNQQTRFEPLLDNARPYLDYSRSPYDTTHVINGNLTYELPFGKGKRFLNTTGPVDKVLGGWQISNITHWQTGSPFSIVSRRATFNRPGSRSTNNTAVSNLSVSEIQGLLGIHKVNGTVYYIDPKYLNPSGDLQGSAVGPDTLDYGPDPSNNFQQIFFNPQAGQLGSLPKMGFTGPSQFALDTSFIKTTGLTERMNMVFRVDIFNVLNHPSFYLFGSAQSDDFANINSSSFMQATGTNTSSRVLQISLKLNF